MPGSVPLGTTGDFGILFIDRQRIGVETGGVGKDPEHSSNWAPGLDSTALLAHQMEKGETFNHQLAKQGSH